MRHRIILVLAVLVGASFVRAQEIVSLTSPITPPNQTNVRLERVIIDMPTQTITLQWQIRDATNTVRANASAVYPTPAVPNVCGSPSQQPTGATLLHTLNTANFSTNSLSKQIFTRLIADCYIAAGTISGTPE